MQRLLMVIFTENFSFGASMLCYLAREYGWEVDIYFVPHNENSSQIELYIEQYQPDLIGVSFKSWERSQALSLAESIRDVVNARIIAGGVHPSLMPDEIAQTGLFDAVVVGDGMGVWKSILDEYMNLNGNIIYGKPHSNKYFYTRHFHSKSQIERMKATETTTVVTALGCPYKCRFCHSGSDRYLPFPVENVAQYILELYNKYGVRNFHFLDDLFAGNVKRLQGFRKSLEESDSDIAFSSQVSGKANRFNKNIAEELVKLGVETVNFGIETASPRLLKFLNKRQTVEDSYRAVQTCREFGLNCVINLMFGIPTQNEDDYKCTLEFVEKAKPDSETCFFYSPYPGTELYDYCFDHQYLPESFDRNRFDWFKPGVDGISEIQLKLNRVDYELGAQYVEKIHRVMDRDEALFERMKIVDLHPWVLVGTTRHYYYKTLIKKLASLSWENCWGYIDIDTEAGFHLEGEGDLLLPQYDDKTDTIPFWCITHSFLGADFRVIERHVQKRFAGDVPLISISSFRRSHSTADINRFMKDKM